MCKITRWILGRAALYNVVYAVVFLAACAFAAIADVDTVDSGAGTGADTDINAAVTPDSAMVGDVIAFDVTLKISKNARVVPPETENGFGDFAVLSWNRDKESGADAVLYRYNLATYKSQNCTIPSIRYLIAADSLYDTLKTEPIPIKIISIMPQNRPDSGLTIKDLKNQQKTGSLNIQYLWILLLIAVAVLIYYILEKRAKAGTGGDTEIIVPLKPPYLEALEALETLQSKKYLDNGCVREYVFELSEIFKRYISRRYDIIASEFTTEEIVAWLEFSDISRDMRGRVEWFFRTSDQVKFAKWKPESRTVGRFLKEVITFLEATKPDTELQYELKTERMPTIQ